LANDQTVFDHPTDGYERGRRLHSDARRQIGLREAVFLPQFPQKEPLAEQDPVWIDPRLQRLGKGPVTIAQKVADTPAGPELEILIELNALRLRWQFGGSFQFSPSNQKLILRDDNILQQKKVLATVVCPY
jgi:hypothetical protein